VDEIEIETGGPTYGQSSTYVKATAHASF